MSETPQTTPDLRERAVKRLHQKRDLATHALVYLLVNGFLVAIWYVTSRGFFWPVFPMAGWGIALLLNAWTVWRGEDFTEDQVSREMARMGRRARERADDR